MLASTRGSSSPTEITTRGGWEASGGAGNELRVRLFGEWELASGARSSAELSRRLSQTPSPTRISFDSRELGAWDSVLINFLSKLEALAADRGIAVDRSGLPGGVQRLVGLARAVPERQGARRLVLSSPSSAPFSSSSSARQFLSPISSGWRWCARWER